MDIAIAPKPKRRSKLGLGALIAAVVAGSIWLTISGIRPSVAAGDVSFVEVKQGRVPFSVPASGVLAPRITKLSTARSTATVEEILAEVGEKVAVGDPILRLSSTDVVDRLDIAKVAQRRALSDVREAELNAQRDAVTQSVALTNVRSQLELEEKERAAKRTLLTQGVISQMEMDRANARVEDIRHQVEGQVQISSVAARIHREKIDELKASLAIAEERVARVQSEYQGLTVVAAMAGTVQDVFVAPGQTVALGEKLASIAGTDDLIARLKVAQSKAPAISIGSPVTMTLQGQSVPGVVVRIDPKVLNGSVTVDARPTAKLPRGVRPEQSVGAEVRATAPVSSLYATQQGELVPYVERDVFVQSGATLVRRKAKFGAASGSFLEVASGLVAGDRIAVGIEPSMYKYPRLELVK